MSEWFKEHAWKAVRWTVVETYRGTFSGAASTTYPWEDVSRCFPVTHGVCRWKTPVRAQFPRPNPPVRFLCVSPRAISRRNSLGGVAVRFPSGSPLIANHLTHSEL